MRHSALIVLLTSATLCGGAFAQGFKFSNAWEYVSFEDQAQMPQAIERWMALRAT